MQDPMDTTPEMLRRAAAIGRHAGLHHVYAGNLPGLVGDLEDTHCSSCKRLLVGRYGYHVREYHVTEDGHCPTCRAAVPGRWDHAFAGQITSFPFVPHDRSRLRVI
jgi:pyruvate formate lyase activating enzyme